MVIEFRRDEVVRGDVRRVYDILSALIESRQAAEYGEGALVFFFSGWDSDPREICDIPEIRRWFVRLTEMFPYWLHFAEKEGSTLSHVLMLLCQGATERSPDTGMVGWRFADMDEVKDRVLWLLTAQDALYEKLGVPAETGERISEEIAEFIRCTLE
jgi:hypothetical protein